MSKFYNEYGYVRVPKGTLLFRQGEVVPEYGAFFALCEFQAIGWKNSDHNNYDSIRLIVEKMVYEVKEDLILIFLISHLDQRALPRTAVNLIYQTLTKEKKLRDDLAVKWRDIELKKNFHAELVKEGILGWLSTIENHDPLEIFILPNAIGKINIRTDLKAEDLGKYNSLSKIEIFPPEKFISASLENIKPTLSHILARKKRADIEDYSIFGKVFLHTNLLKGL